MYIKNQHKGKGTNGINLHYDWKLQSVINKFLFNGK